MLAFGWLILVLTTLAGALTFPSDVAKLSARGGTPSSSGFSDGFFWYFETDGRSQVTFTNGPQGEYSVVWGPGGDFVAGKGWNPGRTIPITYSCVWQIQGNAYLYVYGGFTNPLAEYYIVESFGTVDPSTGFTYRGSVVTDGSLYKVYTNIRVNEPSVIGTATWTQYWSIRQTPRVGGSVTFQSHLVAWTEYGLRVGTFSEQIVAVAGFSSAGSAAVVVS